MAAKLSDYALIGNSRAAALVSNKGSVDWCCLPEFDSPAIFAALLDPDFGGHFSLAPTETFTSSQNYLPDSNVVETRFRSGSGEARLLDAFVALSEAEKARSLFPDHEILRVLEIISGEVEFRMEYVPRVFYGKEAATLEDHRKLGIQVLWKEHIYTLLSTLENGIIIRSKTNDQAAATFSLRAGERVIFSLSYSSQSPAIVPELKETALKRLQLTNQYWENWIKQCKYQGVYQHMVKRSALTLKLLAHAPSGAIIAAPTTSLPEELGGERNWDYRFCWLRDASFTTRVLVKLGFEEEAHAYMDWILHATRLTQPELQVVYSVFGHSFLQERTLSWLAGFGKSRPVRIGNGAHDQFQLDVYGEVLDAVYEYAPLAKGFARDSRKFLLGLGEIICRQWNQPDNGIWEVRSENTHHTHSKVMAWVGLDRLIKLAEKYNWKEAPLARYRAISLKIRSEVEAYGFNEALGSYTRAFNGGTLDASSLVFPLMGYCSADSPRMLSTIRKIKEQLTNRDLVYRYKHVDDGLQGGEGAFGICNFWLAENLVLAGEIREAQTVFEALLQYASPAGLLAEEFDPATGALLGNYPQGFTHIGLICTALTLNEALTGKETAK
ncbi:glycoside hydrolase family 15 protein [Adhaeribacter sp. BT258]|uniref:Glycoside hydrolase family 15 protein n=1 Tax=Adhaeribacter terrigena TaxID=2793070 RepID=A0ABS1C1X9_9BACT|nr:glycoside hydrolase family 15 protein [Adhaeribacter terrigena]MBK0402648.1 glycoside hydrolase family 15 protein [Adhaeribacter terrigena]